MTKEETESMMKDQNTMNKEREDSNTHQKEFLEKKNMKLKTQRPD